MGKFAAYLNLALAVAWLALFFTNDALFVSHEVDLSDHLRGDAFAMAWAGSAICSRLYIALVNYGVELRHATSGSFLHPLHRCRHARRSPDPKFHLARVGDAFARPEDPRERAPRETQSGRRHPRDLLRRLGVRPARRGPKASASLATASARPSCLPVIGRHLFSPRTARKGACR